jgi:glycine/D-amino acid oxidase-like deaminating enzyme
MALTADVVIGGGVTGTSIAFHLDARGVHDVVLVDKSVIAAGGTGRSSACVRQHAELRGVLFGGRCEIVEDEASVRAAFEARAAAQASAAPVQPGVLARAPKRVVLKIVPEKIVSWDHRKLGGRY